MSSQKHELESIQKELKSKNDELLATQKELRDSKRQIDQLQTKISSR